MLGHGKYGHFLGKPIFDAINRVKDQHVVGIPSCEQMQGNEDCEKFEPCHRYAWGGLPTWASPDERLEPNMREREELIAMDAAESL